MVKGVVILKKDYFYWIIFFILFILSFKVLERLWESIDVFRGMTAFTSRLIITVVGFVISILITEKINGVIKKK